MYYEINVAKNGKHYFATHERSLQGEEAAKEMYKHFVKLFPKAEGYTVTLSRWQKTGNTLLCNINE